MSKAIIFIGATGEGKTYLYSTIGEKAHTMNLQQT